MKKKFFILILVLITIAIGVSRIPSKLLEIMKPIKMQKIEWQEIFSLNTLNSKYIAQGVEIYKDYLFFTVHEKDKKSILLIFNIQKSGKLTYLFSLDFPDVATHVSDLSIYNNNLYAIDYASNNLYKIDIIKTLKQKKLIISKTWQTYLKRSGSIIVNIYNNKKTLFISQFIVNDSISVYDFDDLNKKNKKPFLKIKSKYFIQGLYENKNRVYISSNKYNIDPIFIVNKADMLKYKTINLPSTKIINGPGRMIEDLTVYHNRIITSDEETNKLYISKNVISNL